MPHLNMKLYLMPGVIVQYNDNDHNRDNNNAHIYIYTSCMCIYIYTSLSLSLSIYIYTHTYIYVYIIYNLHGMLRSAVRRIYHPLRVLPPCNKFVIVFLLQIPVGGCPFQIQFCDIDIITKYASIRQAISFEQEAPL